MTWSWVSFLAGLSVTILVSLVGVPAMGFIQWGLHKDEILNLRVENCWLKRRVEQLEWEAKHGTR